MADKELTRLLDQLDARAADGYAPMTFAAKAVGKSDDSLHVAVPSGIVSIPFDNIQEIRPQPGRASLEVEIDVYSGDRITHLRRIPDAVHGHPVWPGDDLGGPMPGPKGGWTGVPNTGAEASSSTRTCEGIDTSTSSHANGGYDADQTDDYRQYCYGSADD